MYLLPLSDLFTLKAFKDKQLYRGFLFEPLLFSLHIIHADDELILYWEKDSQKASYIVTEADAY